MSKQYFGTIESAGRILSGMLCQDIDRPSEYMVHIWGNEITSMAVLFDGVTCDNGSTELTPRLLFHVAEKGGISIVDVPEADREKFYSLRANVLPNSDGALVGSWMNSEGIGGSVRLKLSTAVEIEATDCNDWASFAAWANTMRKEKNAGYFRGHGSNHFRLETTLQRNGFHRLDRYCADTLQKFHRHAEAALNERISLNDGGDYSMLMGLAQHFGLPTPLLDWSTSPYIAAYFAFADALENRASRPDVDKVRIFALTNEFINRSRTDSVVVSYYKPYVCPLEISYRNNPRLYAQQGCFLVSNHCNISAMIREIELLEDSQYLFAADLPVHLAAEVLQDLAFMGVSGATLFPGLDGVSRMLKHEMAFGHPLPEVHSQPAQDPPIQISSD